MKAAAHCERLFNQVDDLGAGVAAIGDLLQFGKDDAYPDTLNGVGIVLRQLGANMRGLNTQFLDEPYRGISALEVEREQAAVIGAQQSGRMPVQQEPTAPTPQPRQTIRQRIELFFSGKLRHRKRHVRERA